MECATNSGYCERCDECITLELWQEIYRAVSSVVDHTTLADLVDRYHARCAPQAAEAPATE